MRRCLHACLVGVLALSLSMDAARACWFLRHGCRGHRAAVVACPPRAAALPACGPVEPAACGCGANVVGWDGAAHAVVVEFEDLVTISNLETVSPVDSLVADAPADGALAMSEPTVAPTPSSEPVAQPQPTQADPSAADRPAAVTSVVPDLKPAEASSAKGVQQAVAIDEPVMEPSEPPAEPEPEAAPEEPPMQLEPKQDAPNEAEPPRPDAGPSEPAAPGEPNLFEEADKDLDASDDAALPQDRPLEDAPPMREPADDVTPSAPEADAAPTPSDAAEPPQPSQEPLEAEPATDPVEPPAAANPLDAAERRSGEPARLWVDATGRHSVVGVLVEVRQDGMCVLDTGSGVLEVRSSDLRRRDRDYAEQAAERLATRRAPATSDTVGL